MEQFKQIVVGLLLIAGFAGYYLLADQIQVVRVLAVIGGVVAAVAVGMTTEMGQKIWGFVKESRAEVRRVVWPTRAETLQMTLLVFVMVVVASFVLWVFDWMLSQSVKALL